MPSACSPLYNMKEETLNNSTKCAKKCAVHSNFVKTGRKISSFRSHAGNFSYSIVQQKLRISYSYCSQVRKRGNPKVGDKGGSEQWDNGCTVSSLIFLQSVQYHRRFRRKKSKKSRSFSRRSVESGFSGHQKKSRRVESVISGLNEKKRLLSSTFWVSSYFWG